MFESDSKEESEVPMTRVSDALGATSSNEYCSNDMDDDDHDVEESKLIELNKLILQIQLTAAPDSVDRRNLKEDGHKNEMMDLSEQDLTEDGHKNTMIDRCKQAGQPWQKSPPQNQNKAQFKDKEVENVLLTQSRTEIDAITVELSKIMEENTLMKVEVAEILSIKEKLAKVLYDISGRLNGLMKQNVDLKERLTLTEIERNKIVDEKSNLNSALKALMEEKIDLEQKLKQLLEDSEKFNEQLIDLQKNNDIIEAKNIKLIQEKKCLEADYYGDIDALVSDIRNRMLEMEKIKKVSEARNAENELIKSQMAKIEERAKRVLTNAKTKIHKVELENRELQKKLTNRESQANQKEEMDAMKAAFAVQIHSLKEAKNKAEESKKEEKLKLTEKIKVLEEELKQCKIHSHLKSEQISELKSSNLQMKKTGRKIIKVQEVQVEKKVLKLEEEMKVIKKQSEEKNEHLIKLGKHFMEVLTLAENENSSNNEENTESNRQKSYGMSNGRLSQNSLINEQDDNPEHNSSILNTCQLFVYGIDEHIKRHEIMAEFGKYGTITDAYNTCKGYAFITYSSLAEAQDCFKSMNGRSMFGQTVQIKEKTKKSKHGEGRSKDRYEGTDVHFRRKTEGEGFKGNLCSDSAKSEGGKQKVTHDLRDYDSKRSEETWSNIEMSRPTAIDSSNRVSKSNPKVTTKFILAAENGDKTVDSVAVAGTFTGWVAVPLYFEKECWILKLEVTPGWHQYKFIVDGVWIHDDAKNSVANGSGTRNNTLFILIDAKATEVYSSCLKTKSGNPAFSGTRGLGGGSVKHPAVVVEPEPVKILAPEVGIKSSATPKPATGCFRCELCGITTNSNVTLKDHLQGAKHKNKLGQNSAKSPEPANTPRLDPDVGCDGSAMPRLATGCFRCELCGVNSTSNV